MGGGLGAVGAWVWWGLEGRGSVDGGLDDGGGLGSDGDLGVVMTAALLLDIFDIVLELLLVLGCHSIDLLPKLWLLH